MYLSGPYQFVCKKGVLLESLVTLFDKKSIIDLFDKINQGLFLFDKKKLLCLIKTQ